MVTLMEITLDSRHWLFSFSAIVRVGHKEFLRGTIQPVTRIYAGVIYTLCDGGDYASTP